MPLALGLMSGTSADGISAALVDIGNSKINLVAFRNYLYPESARDLILTGRRLSAKEISDLHFKVGELFAKVALRILKEAKVSPKKILVIGSHGQTIFHNPRVSTLQIGCPALIAEKTKIPVVANFRVRDIAAGGEGAPLIAYFDWFCFKREAPAALQNIGGIANVTVVTKSLKQVFAFDTGPGNCLIDLALTQKTKGRWHYDKNGYWAKQGRPRQDLMSQALTHPYFSKAYPKSTGRELFGPAFLLKYFRPLMYGSLADLAATLTCFTAKSIASAYKKFIFSQAPVKKMIVSGGGTKNPVLMKMLNQELAMDIEPIEKYKIPTQAKEPMAFALLAYQAIRGQPNHIPQTTGAKGKPRILGEITPA